MVTTVGSLAGAALTVGLVGVTLGVTGKVVKSANRQLKLGKRPMKLKSPSRKGRLRRSGII